MTTLLVDHARLLATMDADRREIPDGAVLIEDGVIRWVGPADELADAWRRAPGLSTLDASNLVVLPGMVNTHHHLFQSLTRARRRRRMPSSLTGSPVTIRAGTG